MNMKAALKSGFLCGVIYGNLHKNHFRVKLGASLYFRNQNEAIRNLKLLNCD